MRQEKKLIENKGDNLTFREAKEVIELFEALLSQFGLIERWVEAIAGKGDPKEQEYIDSFYYFFRQHTLSYTTKRIEKQIEIGAMKPIEQFPKAKAMEH